MTTLTINIPDDSEAVISAISTIVSNAGGELLISSSDDDLSQTELDSLKSAYKEALLIKDGKNKGIPISDLWND